MQALRVVHYKYTEEFAETAGLKEDERADTGVIAQEVECIIPDAVRPAGNIVLPDGRQIENFLVVNKVSGNGSVSHLLYILAFARHILNFQFAFSLKKLKLKCLVFIRSFQFSLLIFI